MLFKLVLLIVVIFHALCYAEGGQKKKWLKRFLGPAVLGSAILALSGSWWSFLPALACFAPLALPGYGDDFHKHKVWKKYLIRGLHGLANSLPGLLIALIHGLPTLGILQVLSGVIGSIYFGVFNPLSHKGDKGVFIMDIGIALSSSWTIPLGGSIRL